MKLLGGCEYPYNNHGESKWKESWSSSAPRTHDGTERSYDDEAMKEKVRERAGRMGEISSTEREHVGSSPAGFHVKSAAVTVTIDSNSSSSNSINSGGTVRGRDVSRDHGSKDRNTGSRTSSPSPRNANRIMKSPSRTSTDDDVSVVPVEGASLGGTGLKVTMKKLSGRMFFAATRDDKSYENSFDRNNATVAEEKKKEEIEKEEGMKEGSRGREGRSVALLEYPLFEMKSDVDSFDIITLSNNVVSPTMHSGSGGVQGRGTGTGTGTGDTSGAPALSAPVIPFKDIFYFNAHLIDLGTSQHDVALYLMALYRILSCHCILRKRCCSEYQKTISYITFSFFYSLLLLSRSGSYGAQCSDVPARVSEPPSSNPPYDSFSTSTSVSTFSSPCSFS